MESESLRGPLAAILVLALASSVPAQQNQQTLIGDPNVPKGDWPLLAVPPENPFEASPTNPFWPADGSFTERRRKLGKLLFWDEQVSSDNTMACGTCHFPSTGGSDPRDLVPSTVSGKNGSLGMVPQGPLGEYTTEAGTQQGRRVTVRNPPTMIGSAFFSHVFWDGRAGPVFKTEGGTVVASPNAALENQAVDPPVSPIEMAHDNLVWGSGELEGKLGSAMPLALATPGTIPPDLTGELTTDYATLFDLAFSDDPDPNLAPIVKNATGVTRERFAFAIATYERTLVPNQAPIDTGPLGTEELAGFNVMLSAGGGVTGGGSFFGGCFRCHGHDSANGLPQLAAGGGFKNAFDNVLSDGQVKPPIGVPQGGGLGVRTPPLRNVALKRSFFHNGSITNLDDLIDFYNRQFVDENGQLHESNFPFNENGHITEAQEQQVKAFLLALTDPRVANEDPPFDRPDLYSEREPFGTNEYGTGSPPAAGGPTPDIVANTPFIWNDTTFKVGVQGGPPGAVGSVWFSLATAPGPVLWIDLAPGHVLGSGEVVLDGAGNGTYFLSQDPTPPIPSGPGTTLYAQWSLLDGDAPSRSNAAWFDVQ